MSGDVGWTDLVVDTVDTWQGLLVRSRSLRPPLHLQAGPGRRMRLALDGSPRLWARIEPSHYGYAYVRAAPSKDSPRLLPSFDFVTARNFGGEPRSQEWWRAWSVIVTKALAQRFGGGFATTTTFVGPCQVCDRETTSSRWNARVYIPPVRRLAEALDFHDHAYDDWSRDYPSPLSLRAPSSALDGRVKAFRKLARDGTLPPIILRYFSGLTRYIVIDGHDRLHAALLEGIVPPCLAVLDLTSVPAHFDERKASVITTQLAGILEHPAPVAGRALTIESANRLLISAFDTRDQLHLTTRAWKLDGGVERWTDEVRARPGHADYEDILLAR